MYADVERARAPHFLKKTTSERLPSQVVCLGYTSRLTGLDSASKNAMQFGFSEATVPALSASFVRYRKGEAPQTSQGVFTSAPPFWAWLETVLRSGSMTTLLTLGAYQAMVCLGLFELIDQGVFQLYGNDPCAPEPEPAQAVDRWRGLVICDGPPTIVIVRHAQRRGTLKILDLKNYGVSSWESLASMTSGDQVEPDKELLAARRDPELAWRRRIRVEAWEQCYRTLLIDNGLGSWANTAGSQALSSFKHKFLEHKVAVHCDEEVLSLERDAYFGGRCEAFQLGEVSGPVYHLDVNAMYSACIASAGIPIFAVAKKDNPTVDDVAHISRYRATIATVDLECDTALFPVRMGKETLWPIGRYTTTLCGPELRLALGRGAVKRIACAVVYDSAPIFAQWVAELWALRQHYKALGMRPAVETIKRLMNALPGKFAQRARKWLDYPTRRNPLRWEQWWELCPIERTPVKWRCVAGRCASFVQCGEHPESIPSISAWVTSLGRVRLMELITIAGGENVYYVDTDSLFCNVDGFERLSRAGEIDAGGLGRLKIVGCYDRCEFVGLQHYVCDGRRTKAGLPEHARTLVGNAFAFFDLKGFSDSLWHKHKPIARVHYVKQRATETYKRGRRLPGGRVIPHRLSTW